ncbi:hypothetical protein [Actinoplanes regularis]|uniref:Fimbrial assembly protein (PilN) n=1 Tax=Actinoplanes regularis TaxID=52697 RepID=A0A239BLF7_9ACTN|nr:hypothetical protein [Actinoplanes regularis]GIE88086.1 hypothetical protein Are01nite_45660 [Actinoplanes regularis]SNS08429.1 hypothetical protein SAMN06264365_109295 [Actinoplanes regularis]
MSTTALMPLDPSVSPQQAARILPIRANLLPTDISDGRRARRTRAVVLVAVVVVLALLGSWYWQVVSLQQEAETDLELVTQQVVRAQRDQSKYKDLNTTKNTNKVLSGQLRTLMADDLAWQTLLDLVRTTGADAEARATKIDGSLSEDGTAGGGDVIGHLSVTGTAKDKKAVAAYMKALAGLTKKGIADPFVTNVSDADGGGVDFSLTASITKTALCGRFSKTTCKSGSN